MTKKLIIEKIHRAYSTFLSRDIYLLNVNANERSITHKFAEYLQREFSDWNVDCEYNKNLYDEKTVTVWERRRNELLLTLESEISKKQRSTIEKVLDGGISVYPDIIIHHRGTNDNLVVIEAKKSNFAGIDDDEEKLRAYITDQGLMYQCAFKVTFPIGETILSNFDINENIREIII
jgi:hypothetical protein